MSMKWWTGNLFKRSFVVAASVSLLFASGCSLLPPEQEEEVLPEIAPPQISKKPEYEVTTATLETKVQVIGKLISLEEETLFFTLDGKHLKELYVKPGDKVTAGQVIGELDVDDLVKTLRLERLAFKKEEIAMKETLRQRDEMDPIEFEERSIAFEERKQKLADMEEEIAKATLKAPFGGTIVSLNAEKGDLIKAYDPIAIVADTNQITPAAKLSKTELEKVAAGMEVAVNINSVGDFKGTVKQLPSTSEEPGNGGQPGEPEPERPEDFLIVEIKDLPKNLNRGTPLSLNIITKRTENAIVIPPSTLRSIGSRTYVQVIDEEGKREVDVEIGQQTATQVEVLKGLTPGQKVVGR
ncbi:efflux RND transporter periplasmic adaptor subunit [Paenibacillus arenilitoris]|uniref:Efflux RND transporter periplasmic adaptor subunit n=1 Tax=Paenibacillus arenilitoris TaxID=2772299 RepID=A0A927H6L0_9BACL|nr:efflux RND transporter periplasmic adaptor subunit [Paenibacillus arenilitoris]MBD2870095.1 efflux RND transporter periplasmic adaptor subunit [Paenibacillus arenilitoris]